jgi:hypothetical protein
MSDNQPNPVKVEKSLATKVVITGAPSLDPITVFIEDFEPGKGKITISIYGQSWTSYWGGMSGQDVATFINWCNADYLAGCLAPMMNSRKFDAEVLAAKAKKKIIERRRGRCLDFDSLEKEQARELFDGADHFVGHDTPYTLDDDTMSAIYGDDWRYYLSFDNAPNPEYDYLCRVIKAVQSALKKPEAAAA